MYEMSAVSTNNWLYLENDISTKTSLQMRYLPHAVNCGRFCFWRRQSVFFLFVYEISPEPLNVFVPNSHGRRAWSLTQRV